MIKILIVALLFQATCALGQVRGSNLQIDFKKIDSALKQRWDNEVTINRNLPFPYITAFAKNSYMFYWDTYFINKGLIATNHIDIAKQNTLNLLSIVDRFGYMGNAAISSWGMNRSQPPYLSVMVRDVYEVERDIEFLRYAYPILKKEYHFWTGKRGTSMEDHSTSIDGLQRFSNHATKVELIQLYDEITPRLGLDKFVTDEQKSLIASNYATEAETGMDFTLRFENHCPDFIAVDLNCLIYCLEKNLQWISLTLKLPDDANWGRHAERRKNLINKYCWDRKSGMYYDFNFVLNRRSKIAALTTFQPLWAGIASAYQAKRVLNNIKLFETPYGLTTTIRSSGDEKYQWGSNSIWAPMQLIVADGLSKYGYNKEAKKIAYDYMFLIEKNYYLPVSSKNVFIKRKKGMTYEKYKSDGTINDDEYTANEMMGWTAGVFNYLYKTFNDFKY